MRDTDGRLMPASGVVLGAKYNNDVRKSVSAADSHEARYDQLLDQFGEDMCVYIRMVCDTIITTVPKAVIHSLVRAPVPKRPPLLLRLLSVSCLSGSLPTCLPACLLACQTA